MRLEGDKNKVVVSEVVSDLSNKLEVVVAKLGKVVALCDITKGCFSEQCVLTTKG